jgi:hypothetical protein
LRNRVTAFQIVSSTLPLVYNLLINADRIISTQTEIKL